MPCDPGVEVERLVLRPELHVAAAQADALAVDAGEIGLAADAAGVAAVERVIPDVQLPDDGRIDRRDEVAGVVHDVDDVLVGADAVERRHLVGRQLVAGDLQAPAAVREADDAALLLAPLAAPAGPSSATRRSASCRGSRPPSAAAGRGARRASWGSRRPRRRSASGSRAVESACTLPSKNCFWKYQHGPQESTQPTFRSSPRMCRIMSSGCTPSRRRVVVGAAGGVDVMIARVPAVVGQLDPALQPERFLVRDGLRHGRSRA